MAHVSCALTGVTLRYERVVLIPLAPCWLQHHDRRFPSFERGTRVIEAVPFVPVALPIFGRTEEFGAVREIERDAHVTWLEGRLGHSIDTFVESVVEGRVVPRMRRCARQLRREIESDGPQSLRDRRRLLWDGGLSGCYVARDAWDALVAPTESTTQCVEYLHKEWTDARGNMRRRAEFLAKHPQQHFALIEDSTPPEELDRYIAQLHASMADFGFLEPDAVHEVPDRLPIPGGVRQVFCGHGFHVVVMAPRPDQAATSVQVTRCPDPVACVRKRLTQARVEIEFTPAVFDCLAGSGWRAPRPVRTCMNFARNERAAPEFYGL